MGDYSESGDTADSSDAGGSGDSGECGDFGEKTCDSEYEAYAFWNMLHMLIYIKIIEM